MTARTDTVDRPRTARPRAGLRPSVLVVLVVASLGTLVLGIWGSLRWSLIPVRLDGTVALSSEAKEGPPMRDLVTEGGHVWTIDAALLERMGGPDDVQGKPIEKAAWSRTLTLGGRTVPLTPSREFWRTSAAFCLLVGAALVRYGLRFRVGRAAARADAAPA